LKLTLLAGGTGGAKLARGVIEMPDAALTVVANTADDIEIHGAHVSPDPDLVLFWLADRIDARGWGLEGDTFHAMDRLRARGDEVWFNLGDEDLEIGRDRLRRLHAGERLTTTLDALRATLGVPARVLPMSDDPVRTFVDGIPFQEWMIRSGGKTGGTAIGRIEFRGADEAVTTPEVADAIAHSAAVVIGPSNPIVSIGPILAVAGMREALADALVVAVSPFVNGKVLKGPTADCLRAAGVTPDLAGAAAVYGDLVDAWVADERVPGVPTLVTDVWLGDAASRARLAREVANFVKGLRA
jgi:LPPG:FO 2-phospho-L-lactate transferase